jgi:hypothetical protein
MYSALIVTCLIVNMCSDYYIHATAPHLVRTGTYWYILVLVHTGTYTPVLIRKMYTPVLIYSCLHAHDHVSLHSVLIHPCGVR